MAKKYSFRRLITVSVITVFLVFSIITFIIFNNIYFQNFRSRYISENFYAANTALSIIGEEKENMLSAARQIANDEVVFRAFENGIYIGRDWHVDNGKILNEFSAIDKIGFKQIVNIEKRKVYGIAGGSLDYGVAIYRVENGKIRFIDSSLEFNKKFIDSGNEDYLLNALGKSNHDSVETVTIQENDKIVCIKANVPVGKNSRFFDGRPKGIVQVARLLDGLLLEKIKSITNRDILVIKDGEIITSTLFNETKRVENIIISKKSIFDGDKLEYAETEIMGKRYGGTYFTLNEGNDKITIAVIYDLGITNDLYFRALKGYVFVEVLFLAIVFLIILFLLNSLLMPVEKIVKVLKKSAFGDYSAKIEECGMKELDYIINNINFLNESVKKREDELKELNVHLEQKVQERTNELNEKNILLEKRNEKIAYDLVMAKKVHEKMTQFNIPPMKNYNIFIDNRAVRGIGGDFIDCIMLKDGRIGVVFVDIAGHGLAASLIVSAIKLIVNTYFIDIESPAEALYFLNELINDTFIEGITVSMSYVIIDDNAGKLVMASGAQEETLIITDTILRVEEKGIILGAVSNEIIKNNKNIQYNDVIIDLKKGEKIFMYTDGLVETESMDRDMLEQLLYVMRSDSGIDIVKKVHEIIENAIARDERDDVSYMLIEKLI